MSCNSCNKTPCCCQVPYQIPGPMGPQGVPGIQGNPGPPGNSGTVIPFDVEVDIIAPISPTSQTLQAVIFGGTAPFAYKWKIKSEMIGGPSGIGNICINGFDTLSSVNLIPCDQVSGLGMVEIQVTDALGFRVHATWWAGIFVSI